MEGRTVVFFQHCKQQQSEWQSQLELNRHEEKSRRNTTTTVVVVLAAAKTAAEATQ